MKIVSLFFLLSTLVACNKTTNQETIQANQETPYNDDNQATTMKTTVDNICNCVKTALTKQGEDYQMQMQTCGDLTNKAKEKYNIKPDKTNFDTTLNNCMRPLIPSVKHLQKPKPEIDEFEIIPPG